MKILLKFILASIIVLFILEYFVFTKIRFIESYNQGLVLPNGLECHIGKKTDLLKLRKNKAENYGVIDNRSSIIIPFEYQNILFTADNDFLCRKNGKWGIIDAKNNIKIPFNYRMEDFLEPVPNENGSYLYRGFLTKK